jgi:hypothetical protein
MTKKPYRMFAVLAEKYSDGTEHLAALHHSKEPDLPEKILTNYIAQNCIDFITDCKRTPLLDIRWESNARCFVGYMGKMLGKIEIVELKSFKLDS